MSYHVPFVKCSSRLVFFFCFFFCLFIIFNIIIVLCSKFFDLWYKLSFFQCRIDDNEGKERRVKEIKLAIGDLIRSVARRKSDIALYNNQYERAVCKNFLRKMIARFR